MLEYTTILPDDDGTGIADEEMEKGAEVDGEEETDKDADDEKGAEVGGDDFGDGSESV